MQVRKHPDADMLVEYSSGGLSPAMCVSISTHLHFCDDCRLQLTQLDEIGGSLLEDVPEEALRGVTFESLLLQLEELQLEAPEAIETVSVATELKSLPSMVQKLLPPEGAKWSFLSPSLQVAKIPVGESKYELALHKIKAGGKTPSHDHRGLEVTVVVQGSFSDEDGVYNPGDFLVRQPGDVHKPIASQNELCICVSVVEAPIRLVGPISRVLNPFFSFNPQ